MLGVDDYLLAKLVSSGVLRADERFLEAPIKMSGKLVPDRQSGHGVIAGPVSAVKSPGWVARRRVCPAGVRSAGGCLAGRGVIFDADAVGLG
jgi:hypothetical protein